MVKFRSISPPQVRSQHKKCLGSRNFCWSSVVCGWAPVRRTQLGRANDNKQSATWEATQAFKLLWSSVFLILSFLGLILLVLILMHLCCRFRGVEVSVEKERYHDKLYARFGRSRSNARSFSILRKIFVKISWLLVSGTSRR